MMSDDSQPLTTVVRSADGLPAVVARDTKVRVLPAGASGSSFGRGTAVAATSNCEVDSSLPSTWWERPAV